MGISGKSIDLIDTGNYLMNNTRPASTPEIDTKALQSQKIRGFNDWSRCIWLAS